jgi:hypothetical protein
MDPTGKIGLICKAQWNLLRLSFNAYIWSSLCVSSDLPGLNQTTLNGMILYYRLMTKWSGLGDSTELSRMWLSQRRRKPPLLHPPTHPNLFLNPSLFAMLLSSKSYPATIYDKIDDPGDEMRVCWSAVAGGVSCKYVSLPLARRGNAIRRKGIEGGMEQEASVKMHDGLDWCSQYAKFLFVFGCATSTE